MITTSIVFALVFSIILGLAWIKRESLESFLYYVAGYFYGGDIQSQIALDASADGKTLVTNEGDLVSFVRIKGSRRFIGAEDFSAKAERLAVQMRNVLSDGTGKQHSFAIGFLSDPPGTPGVIAKILQGARRTSTRMGAEQKASIWFDAREAFLNTLCNDEVVIMAVYTLRSGFTPKEMQRYHEWMRDAREKAHPKHFKGAANVSRIQNADFSQRCNPIYPVLASRHKAMMDSLVLSMERKDGGIDVMLDQLSGQEALYVLRRFVDGTKIPSNWRPQVFGTSAMLATSLERESDLAHAMPLSIARQMFTEPMYEDFKGTEAVYKEGYWYASLKLDVCPHENPNPPFSQIVDQVKTQFPYAVNIEVSPNGMEHRKIEQMFAGFFGGFGAYNKSIRDAWREFKEMQAMGLYIGAVRLVCTTWSKDIDQTSDQLATLKTIIQGWGSCTASNESGTPSKMLLATAPALAKYNPAPFLPAPIETIARMLPIFRPASPWEHGQLLLRTEHGKPYPVAFGATNQASWGTIVFAPPGRGKSFLMNCLNAGLLFSPGLSDLPYITIIDKGMSSACVIDMARALLPKERRHQALSIRLRNTLDYAVNVFDTQLGLDEPTQRERDFQISLVSALCPNLGPEASRFIGQVIDTAYKTLGRNSLNAKRWQRALDHEISKKIEMLGMDLSSEQGPRIWDVVDTLFDAGETHDAVAAQRFAVPIMDDLVAASYHESVQDLYESHPTPNGESITEVFARSITTAAREYALLSTYTRFDVGDARVVSIDLEEVLASSSSEEAKRRASVMMLFARQLGAKNYYLKWDEMENMVPDRYRTYHNNRVKQIFETLKFLEYDEFHNAHGMSDVLRVVETDFREGRKYNVVTLLSSQLFQDFPKDIVDSTANFFILGVGSEEASVEVQKAFGLSEAERRVIVNECLGPDSRGAPLFGLFKTNKGDVSQLLFNSASSMEQWAFNSSALDVAVRKSLQELCNDDYWLALQILTQMFPEGTARMELERMNIDMDSDDHADAQGATYTVARRTLEKYTQMNSAKKRVNE